MTAFQTQTFVPLDGNLSITLPEYLRGKNVKLFAEPERPNEQEEEEDAFTRFCNNFRAADHVPMSEEEYIKGIRSMRGMLTGPVDYSDLREETDREL